MAQVVAKSPLRSVDNHLFGIPYFEPLLNSHLWCPEGDLNPHDRYGLRILSLS
jgi:hypothetical protein